MNNPSITVIITARNAERTLKQCLTSVLSVDYNNYKVLFVNDGSEDLTSDILKEYGQKINIITNTISLGPSESRNIASRIADGTYIAFTDADCIVDKDWLAELVKGLQAFPDAVSCGGSQEIPEGATHFEHDVYFLFRKIGLVTDYARKAYSDKIIEVYHNASCNVIYLRDIFIKEGGFTAGLWPGEDVDMDYRLKRGGYKIISNPKSKVYHYRPRSLMPFLSMMFRYGKAQGHLVKKYGFFRRIHALPPIAALAFGIFSAMALSGLIHMATAVLAISFIAVLSYFEFNFNVLILSIAGFVSWNAGFVKAFMRRGYVR